MSECAAGVSCDRSVETTFAHSACSMAAAGLGMTIAHPFTAGQLRDRRVVCWPMVPAIEYIYSMVLPAHRPRPTVVNDFRRAMDSLLNSP